MINPILQVKAKQNCSFYSVEQTWFRAKRASDL